MTIEDLLDDTKLDRFENDLAGRFGLERLVGNAVVRDLLRKEIEESRYGLDQIAEYVANWPSGFDRFAPAWYCDASGIDYGEEFDPEEGDQQDGESNAKLVGISEGFTISYLILFLYGTQHPDELEAWIKVRRIPAAKKVARDVMRVIAASTTKAEQGGVE